MEVIPSPENKEYKLSFHGKGGEYFGVVIVNWLLTALTLGFYYPWAKANQLKYLYGATALNGDRFAFHGTGKEMFVGFIKAVVLFILLYGILIGLVAMDMAGLGIALFYLLFIAIIPLAIHGSYRYRMSRTSWRGIRFGYRGDRNELIINFFKWFLFTLLTFGIYGSWFTINIRKYVIGKIRLGSMELSYSGSGDDYFLLNLKGYFLSLITFGIYSFWWQRDLFNYYVDNLTAHKDGQVLRFRSTATGGDFFVLVIVNMLLLICTLGLGYAWVVTRTMDFVMSKIQLQGDLDLDALSQTEANFTDATGEDVGDMLDIDFLM